jgi:hypothetical protein
MYFNFATGLAVGCPRGPWRLADDTRAAYCAEAGIKPMVAKLRALKRDRKKQDVHDPRPALARRRGRQVSAAANRKPSEVELVAMAMCYGACDASPNFLRWEDAGKTVRNGWRSKARAFLRALRGSE